MFAHNIKQNLDVYLRLKLQGQFTEISYRDFQALSMDLFFQNPGPYSCEGLKLFEPLPDGRVWAAVPKMVPSDGSPRFQGRPAMIMCANLPIRKDEHQWTDLPIAAQLGFELEVAPFPYMSNQMANFAVGPLFMDGNPESPTFTYCTRRPFPVGHHAIVRKDGKPFDDGQFTCLLEYL